jgi:hypothetical protein
MSKTFDDLFNDFLKNLNIDKTDSTTNESSNNVFDAEKIESILEKFGDVGDVDEEVEKTLDDSLGEPHKIERYEQGGLYYEKRIWNTTKGDFIKLIVRDKPFGSNNKFKKDTIAPTLSEQLAKALESENYENAAIIRDLINAEKNSEKTSK